MNEEQSIQPAQPDLFGRFDKAHRAIMACQAIDKRATELKQEGGSKYDADKIRVDLLDPLALEGLAKVLTFGANKYAAHNWRGGISYSRLLGGLFRHGFAVLRGEDIDPESGLPHIDHLGCCWMFLSHFMKTRADLDDRWKGSNAVVGKYGQTPPTVDIKDTKFEWPSVKKWYGETYPDKEQYDPKYNNAARAQADMASDRDILAGSNGLFGKEGI